MCDIKNMTNEELKNLADHIAAELTNRKNKEKSALVKTLKDTAIELYNIDPNYYMSGYIRTDCCDEQMKVNVFTLLLDYFDIY